MPEISNKRQSPTVIPGLYKGDLVSTEIQVKKSPTTPEHIITEKSDSKLNDNNTLDTTKL